VLVHHPDDVGGRLPKTAKISSFMAYRLSPRNARTPPLNAWLPRWSDCVVDLFGFADDGRLDGRTAHGELYLARVLSLMIVFRD
jgi:hypothetical protein